VVITDNDVLVQEFVRMLAACEHRLSNYVLALVPNWTDAEDIVQQTKLKLWEQFSQYDHTKDFGAWACTIAYYEVLAFRTRAGRSRIVFSETAMQRVSKEVASFATESSLRFRLLEQCLTKLTQWQQELIIRCCASSESIRDVALELNRKVDSTRKAVLRIRHELYRCMNDASSKAEEP
jgi:RNA polymerase sigma-70 factor, ECF subfamily